MGAILKQLISRGDTPNYLPEVFKKGKKEAGGRGLLVADMVQMLRAAIASIPQVFIYIDALDECLPKALLELLKSLRDIVRESSRTRVFLAGRPHVWEDIQRTFPSAVVIPVIPNADDIKDYLKMRLDRDIKPEAMNDDLRADIVRIIQGNISDMWVRYNLLFYFSLLLLENLK